MTSDPSGCEEIALALREAGQERASDDLLRCVEPRVRGAVRRVADDAEVDDLVQEALLRITIRFGRWDPGKGGFGPWAATVARNLALDYARQQTHAVSVLGEDEDRVVDESAVRALVAIDDAALLDSVFDRLRVLRDAQALKVFATLCDLVATNEETGVAAVAAAAQLSPSTVRRVFVRIRAVAVALGGGI